MRNPAWQHYFWDFDGTLYDTYPGITQYALYALADFGAYPKPAEVLELLKQTVTHMLRVYAGRYQLDMDALSARFDHYHKGQTGYPLYPGAAETLREIVRQGGRNYLFTHRGPSALRCLEDDGLADCFADHVIRPDGFPAKPAPDALLYLMEKHGVNQQSAVMVGDRQLDLDAGKNAGIETVLFDPDGYYNDATPDVRIAKLTDLL